MTLLILGAVVALAEFLTSLLYGVSRFDPVTLVGGLVVFLGVAAVATLVPALRASRTDPSVALRSG